MPIYFDKRRNKHVARLTFDGKRHYIGSYDTEAEAANALKVKKAMLKQLEGMNITTYKLELEEPEDGISWRRSIGRWLERRRAKRAMRIK